LASGLEVLQGGKVELPHKPYEFGVKASAAPRSSVARHSLPSMPSASGNPYDLARIIPAIEQRIGIAVLASAAPPRRPTIFDGRRADGRKELTAPLSS